MCARGTECADGGTHGRAGRTCDKTNFSASRCDGGARRRGATHRGAYCRAGRGRC